MRSSLPIAALTAMVWWPFPGPAEAAAPDGPKVWAIVVGINNYEDRQVPRCAGSIRDSLTVAQWLTAQWGDSAVLKMNDLGKPNHGRANEKHPDLLPTRDNLAWAVKDWLGERVHQDDVVVIYFAGQSAARGPAPGATAGRAYLLPIDVRSADVGKTGFSLEDALDRAGTARKARVVIWLDTSLAGRGKGGLVPEEGAPSGLDWLRALTRWEGVTAWLASETRPVPEDGLFISSIQSSMGQPGEAHNLLGSMNALSNNKALIAQGFRTVGGVGPGVSLWPGRVVEQLEPQLIVQSGHGDGVTAVIVTSDNARIITASKDSTVRIWKLGEREPAMVRVLTEPFIGVRCLALDRDGRLLLAGDGAGRIVGWDMTQDRPRVTYGPPKHEDPVDSLTFLPDSLYFISIDKGGRSILWDATDGAIKLKAENFSPESISRLAAATRPAPGAPSMVAAVRAPGGGSDSLQTFDARGAVTARFEGPGGAISALDLGDDGRRMVVGDDRGRVIVLDLPGRSVVLDRTFAGEIHLARLSRTGLLAVADERSLRLVEPKAGGSDIELVDGKGLAVPGGAGRIEFSNDGRWLAACTKSDGRVLVWRLGDPLRPIPVAVPEHDAPGLSPAFSADGGALVLGDQDGGLRAWTLAEGPAGPRLDVLASVKPARGKVASLSPSPSGKLLLEITTDDLALVWDLEQGRGCKPLPSSWSSGSFLPDESKLILSRSGNEGGDLVLFDRLNNAPMPLKFPRPVDAVGNPLRSTFGRVVVSRSGKWVAAASSGAQLPLACVWEVETGKLVHTARDHEAGLTDLDFSADEDFLLTASEDGTAKLWPLTNPAIELRSSTVFSGKLGDGDPAITAARVSPGPARRVAAGTKGGLAQLWSWEKGRSAARRLGEPLALKGKVNALTFSSDGRWMAASGSLDKSIRFWDVSGERPRSVEFKPAIHHDEQIGALAGWPNGSMILSGGDDAALRFWDLKDRSLVGSLIAQARNAQTVDWLAYTPEGRFDGSLRGEQMVKWRVGEKIVTLQQIEDTHHAYDIAASIARGEKFKVEPRLRAEGPSLKIFAPPAGPGIPREVELRLWSDSPRPPSLRLYQNGVPVRGEGDFRPGETENFVTTRVQLRSGENRIYAMASRPGSADGRSEEVILRYDGKEPTGRLHTLAIGISEYESRALKYAHIDALGIAEFLRRQGVRGADRPGEQFVLVNGKVTEAGIENAFRRLREAVKGRPQDTVVLFLAGHTDTDDDANQFCLLLPKFPFKDDLPALANVAVRGLGGGPRGNAGDGQARARVGDANVLPYSVLYNHLARLGALQRLVIVDACQAGAILDDKAVGRIQKNVEWGSRKARNSYLLAARRGEPANEVDALEHGLLTYTLLRGMGAGDLKTIPQDLGGFPGPPSADLNRDGFISSDELVNYTDETLPRLARLFPQVVLRTAGPLASAIQVQSSPELEQRVRVQADEESFPLVVVPK